MVAIILRSPPSLPAPKLHPSRPPFFTMSAKTTDPRVINCSDQPPDWAAWDAPERGRQVVKILLGLPPGIKQDKNIGIAGQLPTDLATRFENLTHLYLWRLTDLKVLPALPPKLKCLDVRGCAELEKLPELPATLETLDLGGCSALKTLPITGLAHLRWLHVDGSAGLNPNHLNILLEACTSLEEFTAKDCPQIQSLCFPSQAAKLPDEDVDGHPRFPGRRLKKVVLEGCTGLTNVPDLKAYPWLHHLNLNGCGALATVGGLPIGENADGPTGIRTLYTNECESLRKFRGLDVRKVHQSERSDENVADTFRTLGRFKGNPVDFVMAKVLFLGSGRCGKTTISKALPWSEMKEADRAHHPELNPCVTQSSTERIRFGGWETDLEICGKSVSRKLRGTVHLWDFGGQEVYHNTHRLFAKEGCVFVIATTSHETHQARLKEELDQESPAKREELLRQNEYRELKYWLDYIRNALGLTSVEDLAEERHKASVLIVHTGPGSAEDARRYLKQQAGPYGDLLDTEKLKVVAVDFHQLDFNSPAPAFTGLKSWVQNKAGWAADQFGTRVPELFRDVTSRCDELLKADRHIDRILEWKEWQEIVTTNSGKATLTGRQGEEASRAIARYLHHCGRVFCLSRHEKFQKVIINQQWAVELIYLVTVHAVVDPAIKGKITSLTSRLFSEEEFRKCLNERPEMFWPAGDDMVWPVLMAMLDQCDVFVRAGSLLLPTQRELLRDMDGRLQKELADAWTEVSKSNEQSWINHSFAIHGDQGGLLGGSDYRAVLAFIARGLDQSLPEMLFGPDEENPKNEEGMRPWADPHRSRYENRCWFWKDGFMVKLVRNPLPSNPGDRGETLLLRVEWAHCSDSGVESRRSFEGGLFIQLLSTNEEVYPKRLVEALFGAEGPLAFFADKKTLHDRRLPELAKEVLPLLRGFGQPGWNREMDGPPKPGLRFDVGISYRGTEKSLAERLAAALKHHGLSVYHYGEDERLRPTKDDPERPGGSFITDIYDYLRDARILLVIPSQSYFDDPQSKGNRYCPVELAEAVLAHAGIGRTRLNTRFIWVAGEGCLTPSKIADATENVLKAHYSQVIAPRLNESPLRKVVTKIDCRENQSMQSCDTPSLTAFLDDVGRDAKQYEVVANPGGELRLDELVRRIKQSLSSP
jgi:GTPase SAR1 family protein